MATILVVIVAREDSQCGLLLGQWWIWFWIFGAMVGLVGR